MFIHNRIADAIVNCNSNYQFTNCYSDDSISGMNNNEFRVRKLRSLVLQDGGPAKFAQKRSRDEADKPIDPTYVSQILNGHRPFGEKAAENMARRAGLPADYFDLRDKNDADQNAKTPPIVYQTHDQLIDTLIANLANQPSDVLRVTLLEIELGVVRAKQNRNNVYLERPERRITRTDVEKERRGSPILFREFVGEGSDPEDPLIVSKRGANQ